MVNIIKASGEKEKFNRNKISQSIMNAGASHELAEAISARVQKKVYNNIPSEKILDITLKNLRKHKGAAARYDLKRGIMLLGPTGFPFENYFALVLKEYGYSTKVGQVLNGKNITHEVDIVAKKKLHYMIECKFHNKLGIHTRVKIPLYVYARFLDLQKYFNKPWLATNTKCTTDSRNYAKGVSMKITSWDYPRGEGLKDMVTQKKLYPVTIIRCIGNHEKEILFEHGIYLVKTLLDYDLQRLRHKTGFSKKYCNNILDEAKAIMGE